MDVYCSEGKKTKQVRKTTGKGIIKSIIITIISIGAAIVPAYVKLDLDITIFISIAGGLKLLLLLLHSLSKIYLLKVSPHI